MEKNINNWFSNKWVREVLLYFVVLGIFVLGDYNNVFLSWKNFLISIGLYTLLFVHAMVHRLWLFPILFDKKQKLRYFSFTLVCLVGFSLITYYLEKYFILSSQDEIQRQIEELQKASNSEDYINFWTDLFFNIFVVLFFCSIYFIIRHFDQEKNQKEIKLLINQLEINQLREQLNPHFMFNTLNNLYGVSLEQPERIPDLILKLSQMMRYQLEATKKEFVLLNDEIEFVESFIGIENERVSNRCEIYFEKQLAENNLKIAPILLLPFVENAFKHSTDSAEKSFIKILVKLNQAGLFELKIQNSIPLKKKYANSTGVGLENVKQRLLKLYDGKYELEIETQKQTFNVKLTVLLH